MPDHDQTADPPIHERPPDSSSVDVGSTGASECVEPGVSFEEFRLYFETASAVTEGRNSLNRYNYTITTAILLALGVIAKFGIDGSQFRVLAVGLIVVFSALAMIFCVYWVAQIDDAKRLNKAKFDILEKMAPLIVFDASMGAQDVRSFRPFEKEWAALQQSNGLSTQTSGRGNFKVLKSSRAEYFVPKSLGFVFGAILILALVVAVVNRNVFIENPVPRFETVQDVQSSGEPLTLDPPGVIF